MSNYPIQPETLIPTKYAALVAELAAVEELFAMRLGVTMNCGDIRLLRTNEAYAIHEKHYTKSGKEDWRFIAKYADIVSAVVEFRRLVVGGAQ